MLKRLVVLIASLLLAPIFFEVFLRMGPYSHGISPVQYDSEIGMWHKSNFKGVKKSECYYNEYAFDENGLVTVGLDYVKSNKDVVILGDSYTEALMVSERSRISNVLAEKFNGVLNVLNYGLAGTSPIQHYVILERKVNLSSAAVVLHFINVDSDLKEVVRGSRRSVSRPLVFLDFADVNNFEPVPPVKQNMKEKLRDVASNFELFALMKKVFFHLNKKMSGSKNMARRPIAPADYERSWVHLKGAILAARNLTLNHKIDYVVAYYASTGNNSEVISSFLNQNSISSFNIKEYLESKGHRSEELSYGCDRHWNEFAHEEIANGLYNAGLISVE